MAQRTGISSIINTTALAPALPLSCVRPLGCISLSKDHARCANRNPGITKLYILASCIFFLHVTNTHTHPVASWYIRLLVFLRDITVISDRTVAVLHSGFEVCSLYFCCCAFHLVLLVLDFLFWRCLICAWYYGCCW